MEEMKNYYYFCITLCLAEFAIKTENYNIQIKKNIYIQKKKYPNLFCIQITHKLRHNMALY